MGGQTPPLGQVRGRPNAPPLFGASARPPPSYPVPLGTPPVTVTVGQPCIPGTSAVAPLSRTSHGRGTLRRGIWDLGQRGVPAGTAAVPGVPQSGRLTAGSPCSPVGWPAHTGSLSGEMGPLAPRPPGAAHVAYPARVPGNPLALGVRGLVFPHVPLPHHGLVTRCAASPTRESRPLLCAPATKSSRPARAPRLGYPARALSTTTKNRPEPVLVAPLSQRTAAISYMG